MDDELMRKPVPSGPDHALKFLAFSPSRSSLSASASLGMIRL